MSDDLIVQQIRAIRNAKEVKCAGKVTRNYRYVVYHCGDNISYYDYYYSKFAAYFEAINPRYWRCHTVVMLDVDKESL